MAGFAVMVNTVMGSALSASTGGLPTPGVSLPTREELETSTGIVAGLWSASNMFGVVTLSLWAFFTAQDYSSGLIRLLVASEPNRLRLLAGKAITLAGFTALAVTVAVIANIVAAPAIGASGISTAAWGQDLPTVLGKAWINLYLSQLVWGMLGLVIAVVSRSAMTAVSLGVGYVLTVESIVRMIDGAPVDRIHHRGAHLCPTRCDRLIRGVNDYSGGSHASEANQGDTQRCCRGRLRQDLNEGDRHKGEGC
jgi:hypothetical protein